MLDRLTAGDHVCWTVDDEAVRLNAITSFVRAGLNSRQRVIYCGDDPADVLDGMRRRGLCPAGPIAGGQLRMTTPGATYLAGGRFDPGATVRLWHAEIRDARDDGFLGVRVLGDMSWAARGVPGAGLLPSYEARINSIFAGNPMIGVCLYDPRLFGQAHLRRISAAHPGAAGPVVPFDPGMSLRMRCVDDPYGLRLIGEADMANRVALAAVLTDLLAGPPADLDLSGLTFADIAAARVLAEALATRPGHLRPTGCPPALRRLLSFLS